MSVEVQLELLYINAMHKYLYATKEMDERVLYHFNIYIINGWMDEFYITVTFTYIKGRMDGFISLLHQ